MPPRAAFVILAIGVAGTLAAGIPPWNLLTLAAVIGGLAGLAADRATRKPALLALGFAVPLTVLVVVAESLTIGSEGGAFLHVGGGAPEGLAAVAAFGLPMCASAVFVVAARGPGRRAAIAAVALTAVAIALFAPWRSGGARVIDAGPMTVSSNVYVVVLLVAVAFAVAGVLRSSRPYTSRPANG